MKVSGVLDLFEHDRVAGWVAISNIQGFVIDPPFIEVYADEILIANGQVNVSRPDIEKPGILGFGFNLLYLINIFSAAFQPEKLRCFAIVNNVKFPITVAKVVSLTLIFRNLSEREQRQFYNCSIIEKDSNEYLSGSTLNHYFRTNERNSKRNDICVISYANDSTAWFPFYYKYYSELIGASNIYIVTPSPQKFVNFKLGGIMTYKDMMYDDHRVAWSLSFLANSLKAYYEWTIICDIDEIIQPHPMSNLSFHELLQKQSVDIVRTKGFDIIAPPLSEDFNFSSSILSQRKLAIPNSSLSKPHFSRSLALYSAGFHFCSSKAPLEPDNVDCFLTLHLKFACNKIRREVLGYVKNVNYADKVIEAYSRTNIQDEFVDKRVLSYLRGKRISLSGLELKDFFAEFNENIKYSNGIWHGKHVLAPFLVDFDL